MLDDEKKFVVYHVEDEFDVDETEQKKPMESKYRFAGAVKLKMAVNDESKFGVYTMVQSPAKSPIKVVKMNFILNK